MIRDPSDGTVRPPEAEQKAIQPMTFYDFKARYLENWGIGADAKQEPRKPQPAPTAEQLRYHYQHYDLGFKPRREAAE